MLFILIYLFFAILFELFFYFNSVLIYYIFTIIWDKNWGKIGIWQEKGICDKRLDLEGERRIGWGKMEKA